MSGRGPREAFFGNAAAARESAKPALQLCNHREVEYGRELALAKCPVYASADTSWFAIRASPSAAQ
jgi:hypothetical protein